jgi:DNA-binding FadR family transcriptional regulator
MKTENSHLIAPSYPFADIFARINGVSADRAGRPMLIAWKLEEVAAQSGWHVGSFLGTERELIEQFGVSRDTMREAVRIVEARGSMQMQRGRVGGLRLLSPRVEEVASALAAYLHASNCSKAELEEAALVAGPVLAELDAEVLVVSLYRQTIKMLSASKAPGLTSSNRARTIAARLLESHGPPPGSGIFLGDEALLSEKLGCTRPALREALRILADLSILKVRRGRGGGFTLVQPSPDAIVRRVFGLIAAQHVTRTELRPTLRALDLIRLRLAIRQLRLLDDQTRQLRCDKLASLLDKWSEPVRWFNLQRELDRIANNNIISILTESFIYYLARQDQTDAIWNAGTARCGEIDASLLATGGALVRALRESDYPEAERLHLIIHSRITWALNNPDIPGIMSAS